MSGTAPSAAAVFDVLRCVMSPGPVLGAKLAGAGAVEARAQGAMVRLSDGRDIVDFGSYGVTLLGHRHPAVVAAVKDCLGRMPTATRVLANPDVAAFVSELVDRVGGRLRRVWLGSDGADAVEVALKLSRRETGRVRVLAAKGAFHGKTLGALAVTWNPAFHVGLADVLNHVTHLEVDDPGAVAREAAARDVAALVVEPIQGEGGVRPLDLTVLRRWCADARAAGAFVISDEVQVGLRRCGPISVALDAGLDPDGLLLGKALGGGVMPLAALVATDELYGPLAADPTWHSSTFGGHPLAAAAGRAALAAIDEHAERGRAVAATLLAGVQGVAARRPDVVRDVRAAGLLIGVELATPAAAGTALLELAQAGVLVSPCLSDPRTLRLLPPMLTTDEQLARAVEALGAAVDEAGRHL